MRWRVLAALGLAILAGCSGFSTGGGDATPTLTPAPVPERDLPRADGVWQGGIDAETVVETHRAALSNASYTAVETLRVGRAGNASFHQRTAVFVAPGGTPLRVDDEVTEARPDVFVRGTDVWWNGEQALYRRTFTGNQQTYYSASERPSASLRIREKFATVLEAVSVSSVEAGANGSTIVAGVFEDAAVVPRTSDLSSVENATMTFEIGSTGVLTRAAIGYEATARDGSRQRVRYTYRVTALGSTTVEPPAWVAAFGDGGE